MDEIDYFLLKKLLENSRVTYRELADMTDMSVSAIHKRIRSLVDDGFITTFIARPSFIALKSLLVLIYGTSNAKSMDEVSKELGQHESIHYIGISGGKYLQVSAFLRNLSELQEFGSYVSKTAHISEPTIAIVNLPYLTLPEPLTSIDFKIIIDVIKSKNLGALEFAAGTESIPGISWLTEVNFKVTIDLK